MNKRTQISLLIEIVDTLKDSIDQISETYSEVAGILYGTDKAANFEAYGGYGFDQLLGNGNPYDSGLPQLVEHFEKQLKTTLALDREHENKYNSGGECSDKCPRCFDTPINTGGI